MKSGKEQNRPRKSPRCALVRFGVMEVEVDLECENGVKVQTKKKEYGGKWKRGSAELRGG